MNMTVTLFLSLGIFFIFGVVYTAVLLVQQSNKQRRLMRVIRGEAMDGQKSKAASTPNQRRADLAKKLQEENGKPKKSGGIKDLILQAGLETSMKKFWLYSLMSCAGLTLFAKFMGASPFVTIMAVVIGFFGVPKMVLKFKAKRRQKQFMNDFADALESMMRLLKAGMPVSEAIKMVAREFTGPMGEIMERVYEQQKIGVPLPEAILDGARRMPLTEMQMLATAIAIQTQTGSSLSEVLQNLANVIRSRFKLKRKVQALSQEAKSSAMIIGALPVVVAGGMYFINREYIEVLFIDPTGKFLLGCALAWMFVGVLVMRQMINFKV